MIDLHTHTLFSDGVLLPSELAQRAKIKGIKILGITDHVDESNLEFVFSSINKFANQYNKLNEIQIVPGIEITHVSPKNISYLVDNARKMGIRLIIVHGETIVEPVEKGTNIAALNADIDILAHPGFITQDEVELAKKNNIFLEITTRKGHSLTNGHVVQLASLIGAGLVINTDSHNPEDISTPEWMMKIGYGAGMSNKQYEEALENSKKLYNRIIAK